MFTKTVFSVVAMAFQVLLPDQITSYSSFQASIPNGYKIPHPCNPSLKWDGVGHDLSVGTGPLNDFGRDFLSSGLIWNSELCSKDSDNDGKTNGEELGDPACTWQQGVTINSAGISHPGICEPVESQFCRQQSGNKFLENVEICSHKLNVTSTDWCPWATQNADVKTVELRFENISLGSLDTYYLCEAFTVPADEEYHIIAWEPIIDNREVLHHMILYTCNSEEDETALNTSSKYQQPEDCQMSPDMCFSMAIVWAPVSGVDLRRCYPNDTGILMGKGSFSKVILQHHYNNPSQRSDIVDSSGIRMYYTTKLREHHTSMMVVGQEDFVIPPEASSVKVAGSAFRTVPQCGQDILGNGTYQFSGLFFHMHKLGSHAKLTIQKADGRALTVVDEDVTYDRPKVMFWATYDDAPLIEAGDHIDVECTFTSTSVKNYTFFGAKTAEEMCYVFLELKGRPSNKSFHWMPEFQKGINICNYLEWDAEAVDRNFVGCSYHKHWYIWYVVLPTSGSNGFYENCKDQPYPAQTCSTNCNKTIEASGYAIDDPCISGSLMKAFLTDEDEANRLEEFVVISQIKVCSGEVPTTKPETTTKTSVKTTAPAIWQTTTSKAATIHAVTVLDNLVTAASCFLLLTQNYLFHKL